MKSCSILYDSLVTSIGYPRAVTIGKLLSVNVWIKYSNSNVLATSHTLFRIKTCILPSFRITGFGSGASGSYIGLAMAMTVNQKCWICVDNNYRFPSDSVSTGTSAFGMRFDFVSTYTYDGTD